MARKKRLYNYQFEDCNKSFERTVEVKCTQTGETVKMYHKHLAKMIDKKFRNRYNVFKTSYIKKGNKPAKDENNLDDYNSRPEGYRKFLITQYMGFKNSKVLSETDKNLKMHFVDECYSKRWGEPILEVFKRAEGTKI